MTDLRGATSFKGMPTPTIWCVTDRKERKLTYVWTVKKFTTLQLTNGECLESSTFSAVENDKNKWSLVLYPKGQKRENTSYVSLFLKFLSYIPDVCAPIELSILDKNLDKIRCKKIDRMHNFTYEERECGFGNFIKRDELMKPNNGFMQDDSVTFCCDLCILAKPKNTSDRFNSNTGFGKDSQGCSRLADDVGRLLNSKTACDVVLVAEDQELHAHEAFLIARSPVFAAMFEHDMEEKQNSRVVISDILFSVLEELIRFIYTAKTPTMD